MNFWTISTVGIGLAQLFFFYFRTTLNLKEMTRSSKKILILGISNWSKHHFAPISSCATILFSIFIDQMAWQFSIFHTAWQNDKTPAPNLLSTTEEVCSIADVPLFFDIGSISWKVATFHSMEYHTDVRPLSNIGVIFELPVKREISFPPSLYSPPRLCQGLKIAACVSLGLENNDLCCHHHQRFAVLDKADHERFSFISLAHAHTSRLTSFWR